MNKENKEAVEILIVEDSLTQAEQLRYMLEQRGYHVLVAYNGKEALDLLSKNKPSIVISDIIMPEMDGYELCKRIKSDENLKDIPVILLTALSDPKDVLKGLECGADNFVTKPYDEKYLCSRINYLLVNLQLRGEGNIQVGLEIFFEGQKYYITSERQQILSLLLSTYETAVQKNLELIKAQDELKALSEQLEQKVKERTAALKEEIAERKRAEEMLRRVNRAYKTLSVCSQTLVHATDEADLLREICRVIVEAGGYLMALVGYAEQDEQKTVRAVAQMGYEEIFLKTVNLTWADTEQGHGPLGTAIRTHTPSIFQDIPNESKKIASWREAALKRGYASAIGLPLIADSDLLGALAIYSAEPYAFDEEEIKLLTELADDLAYGIMTLRARAERKRAEEYQKMVTQVLELLNKTAEKSDITRDIILLIKELTGFEAVGVRLKEGVDFPYYHTSGFPSDFVEAERYLCARDHAGELIRDSKGNPYLECMCGNVICGRTNPALPFFTKGGSFWTNSTTELLASTTEEDRQARTRNRCNGEGYESVALIPLRSDSKIIGLLQLNDSRKGMFTLEMVSFLESIGDSIGIALARRRAEEAIEWLMHRNELILNSAGEGILGLDLQGNHTFVNPAAAGILGYEVEELIGRNSHTTWHHSRADGSPYPREECSIYAACRDGAVHTKDDEVFWRKDGTSFPVRYTSSPISEEGKLVGAVVSFRDITERKRTEKTLRETRDYLENLFNYANAPIIVWDSEFRITRFNHAFEYLTGYLAHEVIGKELHTLFPEESKDESLHKIERTLSGEYWESVEIPIFCKGGDIRIALWNSANIYTEDGKTLLATIAQGLDITERKQAEESLLESEKRYKRLVESTTNYIYTVEIENGKPVSTKHGSGCVSVTGYTSEEYEADPYLWYRMIHGADREAIVKQADRLFLGEVVQPLEHRIIHKDGSMRWVKNTPVPRRDEQGRLIAYDGLISDITERKQAEEALKRSHDGLEIRVRERTKELKDMNLELQVLNKELNLRRQKAEDAKLQAITATRAKSDFLANMSHELRTPLNSIIGFSDMMFHGMTGKLTEQQHEYLCDIKESGLLLLSLINDILDLSKVEAGKLELEFSEFDLKELIEGSLVMFKEKALKHNIKVKYEVDERIGSITADERRLKQVMFNLLSNAVKFTPDGGSVRVTARRVRSEDKTPPQPPLAKGGIEGRTVSELQTDDSELDFDMIEISVEDTGIGIRPEDIDKLFQPFQQLEYTLTKKYEGTGLGLTLCKRIVELHHGRIWVESEVGKGSKFTFVIPAKQKKL